MSGDERDNRDDEARRLEREARLAQGFSPAAALAGRDGGGHLRGASPISRQQRFAYALAQWLEIHLADGEGSLVRVILREVGGADGDPARPWIALAAWLAGILSAPGRLRDLVREVDAQWGRDMAERPRFEPEGQAPAADDPYTIAGVEAILRDLQARCQDSD